MQEKNDLAGTSPRQEICRQLHSHSSVVSSDILLDTGLRVSHVRNSTTCVIYLQKKYTRVPVCVIFSSVLRVSHFGHSSRVQIAPDPRIWFQQISFLIAESKLILFCPSSSSIHGPSIYNPVRHQAIIHIQ